MQADFVLDYDVLTVQRPQRLYLLARLATGPAQHQERRPLNLSLVLDRSGSMAGAKLDFTREAAQFLVQNLGSQDRLSIILYNDKVETLFPPEPVRHKDMICQRIEGIKAGGTTNLSGGWLEGCNFVARYLSDDSLNRVILMTDGLANRGIIESDKLISMAGQKKDQRIITTTMGLGEDFNEDLLIAMANAGGGAFYFIESAEVAPVIFAEELRGLLNVIGQNLVITLELTDHVTEVKQLNAYPVETSGGEIAFRLGDVFTDEIKTLALELTIPALAQTGQMQIAMLRFDYDELTPDGVEHRVLRLPVIVNVEPPGAQPALPDPSVRQSILLLKSAQARNEAVRQADRGRHSAASEVLRRAAEDIASSGIDSEVLADERQALLQQAEELERSGYDEHSRKVMSTEALYTMTDRHQSTQAMRVRELQRILKDRPPSEAPPPPRTGEIPLAVTWNEKTFALQGDLIRIGRADQNEIIIKAKGVSRFHCQIKRQNGQLILEDLNSTNGTIISGEPIKTPYTLSVGDVIYLCDERLTFHI